MRCASGGSFPFAPPWRRRVRAAGRWPGARRLDSRPLTPHPCGATASQEITAWFNALDIDGSGTVEEDEVRAMCNAMGVEINNAKLTRMFAAVDRPIDASLTKSEFVHFMNVNADLLAPSSFVGGGGGGGHRSLFDANTKLMMLAYRRQRLIDDMEDPVRRRNFAASLAALAPQPPPPADDDASSVLPHRMALLPAARAEAAAARRSPRRLVPSPRPPSTMLVPMPPSGLVSSLVPGNATMRRVPPPPHSPRALPPISPRSLSEEQGVPRPADACPTWEGAGAEAAAEAAVEAAAEAAAEAMDRGTEGALSIPARNLA